ncbi:sigma-70 family RNA polymerase sigma factor [Gemmata sp. JC717]|uniref:RNA polymerase sigma factor n=1 Tax=Gemmata algarum TaxID=2975278 RepID=UPI0021BADC73|nr:sigma-70 family RNA polymerase sigma factor [Gemmata algarum]MDY3552077.1 sigma-70 family RNA polymerase sigma factor [Gemmata algarum]
MRTRSGRGGMLDPVVRAALVAARLGELSDGELLARFVATRDEEAFAELVRRLGPTVYGVCHRVLGTRTDAEDAFQVTFLVLARKADTVRPPGRVAAWLHGVAVLTARKARAVRLRRHARERALGDTPEPSAVYTPPEPDLARVLDEEIQRLPDKYRAAVVLCEVRGLTVAQTAAELGLPVGTVASRLARGRVLLASRLTSRGGAGAAAVGGLASAAMAAPAKLFGSAVSVAFSGSQCAPGAQLLLNEVLRAMSLSKLRAFAVATILSSAVALGGAGLLPSGTAPALAAPVPKSTPGAADPLDRVKADNLAGLLKVEAIRKDIQLTAEQAKKVDELRARRKQAVVPNVIQQGPVGGGVIGPAVPAVPAIPAIPVGGGIQVVDVAVGFSGMDSPNDPEFYKAAAEILKPEQMRRLKQLSLQAMGPVALLDRRVIRALGLSAEQEDKIEAVAPPDRSKNGGTLAVQIVNGRVKDLETERDKGAWEAALKVLTAEQRAKWDSLVGKVLPPAELRKAQIVSLEEIKDLMPNLPNVPNINPIPVPPPG